MQIKQTINDGVQALRTGDAARAYSLFSEAVSQDDSDRNALMGLALSARALRKPEDALAAAGKLLDHEPKNWQALIVKADALDMAGKRNEASACYLEAVNAAPPNDQLPAEALAELNRARQACSAAAAQYENYLRERVRQLGVFDGSGRSRGEQALDVLFGRKQIYLQQPEKFYFPELPQIQFYDPSDYEWTKRIVEKTAEIKKELEGLIASNDRFEPYVPKDAPSPHVRSNSLAGNPDWGAFHFIKEGVVQKENAAQCPNTMGALALAPQPNVRGQSPVALFSRLKPGARIPPHHGLLNTRLICHLPIVAPEGCVLRVGNQERRWRTGEMLMFDDSIEHEAHNPTNQDRVVLLFDIWRPELSEDDRAFVTTVFNAIEEFGVF